MVFASNVDSGLSHVYAQNSANTWDYREPTEVHGYPAVGFEAIADKLACADVYSLLISVRSLRTDRATA